jgi:hypothetical protein
VVAGRQEADDRLDLGLGKRSSRKETGTDSINTVQLTSDGKCYCYSFMRNLARLFVADGLR